MVVFQGPFALSLMCANVDQATSTRWVNADATRSRVKQPV